MKLAVSRAICNRSNHQLAVPLFLVTLGASKTELSLIEGIAESTASVLKAVSGWWSDRIDKNKPLMAIGYAFTAFLSPLFAIATSPLQVLVIRFTERVGEEVRTAPRDSLVAASCQHGPKGKSFGFLPIVLVFTLGNSTDTLLLAKASDVGISDAFIPIMYVIYNAVSVLFSVPSGMLSDRIGNSAPFFFSSAMALTAALLLNAFYRRGRNSSIDLSEAHLSV